MYWFCIWCHHILAWITPCISRRTTAAILEQLSLTRHENYVLFYLRFLFLYWNSNIELYLHLHMCSLLSLLNMCYLLYLLNMCSLLKCEYLFCNQSLSFFVILRLERHVCIMLTFMFCEINNIIYLVLIHNNTSQIYFGFKCKTSLTSSGIICIQKQIPSHFL